MAMLMLYGVSISQVKIFRPKESAGDAVVLRRTAAATTQARLQSKRREKGREKERKRQLLPDED